MNFEHCRETHIYCYNISEPNLFISIRDFQLSLGVNQHKVE